MTLCRHCSVKLKERRFVVHDPNGVSGNFCSADCYEATRTGRAPICKPCNSDRSTRSRYGLSEEEFSKLRAVGACPICKRNGVAMEVDHSHKTGAVRAILCSRCNGALGFFEDNPVLLRRAALYLESYDHG